MSGYQEEIMSLAELLPLLKDLPLADKLRIIQVLAGVG